MPPPQDPDQPKRAKRVYRACVACRTRKLKCDLGDPDAPSDGPCRRCRRESRECLFNPRPGETFKRTEGTPGPGPARQPTAEPPARYAAHPYAATPSTTTATAPQWGSQEMYSPSNPALPHALPSAATAGAPAPPPRNPYFHAPPPRNPPLAAATSYDRAPAPNAPSAVPDRPDYGSEMQDDEDDEDDDDQRDEDEGEDGDPRRSGSSSGMDGVPGEGENSTNGNTGPRDSNILLSSTLHNPADALRLLATASSMRSSAAPPSAGIKVPPATTSGPATTASNNNGANHASPGQDPGWTTWPPIVENLLTQAEAEVLFAFFETEMSPLYPLLPPDVFSPSHLPVLTSSESLLLCAMVTIAARYSSVLPLPRSATIHTYCANYLRQELIYLIEGSSASRHISSVETLLLLTEWPSVPLVHGARGAAAAAAAEEGKEDQQEVSQLLKTSAAYDAMSWTYIGMAVRLAQELQLDNTALYELEKEDSTGGGPQSWHMERVLRTWIYCYNADRHVSVRLGRNAVIQAYMSTAWWEKVTQRASIDVQRKGLNELWAERTLPQGLMTALMGTIQDRLYPNKEITRSILRTGHWESFIRSLDHELKNMAIKTRTVLKQGNVESTLLSIEIEYVRLYGYTIALRALQERLRRRVKANDLLFVTPSLLNLQEGPWIIDSLHAAQNILHSTIHFLEPKGYLRLCPSRIFQRILFAATYLLKALAVGVIEHGQSKTLVLLEQAISALHWASLDSSHIARGFSALLSRLQALCIPALLAESGSVDPAAKTKQAFDSPRPSLPRAADAAAATSNHLNHGNASSTALSTAAAAALAASQNAQGLGLSGTTPAGPAAGPSASSTIGGVNYGSSSLSTPSALNQYSFPSTSAATTSGVGGAGTDGDSFGLSTPAAGAGANLGFEMPWEWDPIAGSMDVGKEQDMLFNNFWNSQTDVPGINPVLSLFGTLGGDWE